jgi:hypothetical protein
LASKRRTTPKRSDFKAVNLPIWGILWQFNIGSCQFTNDIIYIITDMIFMIYPY